MEHWVDANGSLIWGDNEVSYCLDEKELSVTVDDVWEDDFSTEELLNFLLKEGVIKDARWIVEKVQDTDGRTYLDDVYTTVTFKKSS